jgi:anti-repressor protein
MEYLTKDIQMTSRELAEITGKRHDHVIRDIRNEIETLGEINAPIFGLVEYQDAKGENRPQYIFGKKGAMQLALKYDAVTRYKVIEKLEELEKQSLPTGQNLLALAIIEAQKMLEQKDEVIKQQGHQIETQRPKVIFADAVAVSSTSILVGDLAKLIKQNGHDIGQKRLFDWLRDNNYLMKSGSSKNMPTQSSMDMKLFEVKESTISNPDGSVRITKTTKVTGKGQIYFINKFCGIEKTA